MKRLIVIAVPLMLMCTAAFAQTLGEITGEVKDPSGAIAPNAAVTATNTGTNVSRSTVTNDVGIYSFPGLNPGPYQVKVAASGFETAVRSNIDLQVQQTARIDFTLTVGQAAQTVEVSANSELLTTDNATVGTVIEQEQISGTAAERAQLLQSGGAESQREFRFRAGRTGQLAGSAARART